MVKYKNKDGVSYWDLMNKDRTLYCRFHKRMKDWGISPEKSFEIVRLGKVEALKAIGAYITPAYKTELKNGLTWGGIRDRLYKKGMTLEEAVNTPRLPNNPDPYTIDGEMVIRILPRKEYCRFIRYVNKGFTVKEAFEKAKTRGHRILPPELRALKGAERRRAYNRWHKLGWSLEDAVNTPLLSQSEAGKRGYAKSPWRDL